MKRRTSVAAAVAAVALAVGIGATGTLSAPAPASDHDPYEVWLLDQTDSRPGHGGLLHVYGGRRLERTGASARPETIDLAAGTAQLCRDETGANPVRPHMLLFNGGERTGPRQGRFAIIAWVVSGHVTIHDAHTREVLACLRTTPGAGGARQAHAAYPTPDGRHLIVANQNGKQVERISTDWENRRFAVESAATLSLYEGQTPSGADRQQAGVRPDNAPICVRPTDDGRFTFVSLRGGGAFVVDHGATPMRIVAEYDKQHIDDFGCGQAEARGKMFLNAGSGAGNPAPFGHAVYAIDLADLRSTPTPPNTPRPRVVYERAGQVDAHGFALTQGDRHLLVADRAANDVTVVDTKSEKVIDRFSLEGSASGDPAPDLLVPAPDGRHVFASLRGPAPLSGGHDDVRGATPGVGVIRLAPGRRSGSLVAVAPARRSDERPPDPHGIAVRHTAVFPGGGKR